MYIMLAPHLLPSLWFCTYQSSIELFVECHHPPVAENRVEQQPPACLKLEHDMVCSTVTHRGVPLSNHPVHYLPPLLFRSILPSQ